jgi:hypothetical protein
MIEWLSTVNPALLWLIFIIVALIMAIIPFYGKLKKALQTKFSNTTPEIVDFSWRHAPDHLMFKVKDKEYYLQANGTQFIIEGGALILSWDVKGAFQVDISGIGADLKGNSATIRANKQQTHFELVAHTTDGKIRKTLELDPAMFRTLGTFNLSQEGNFVQKKQHLKTEKITQLRWMHGKYKHGIMAPLPKIHTQRAEVSDKRYRFKQLLTQKTHLNPLKEEKNKINGYIGLQKIVKKYKFNPKKYHAALNAVNNQENPNQ